MKKILTILLALVISTSAFGNINITVINDTNVIGGWNAIIESKGQLITRFRYMRRKNKTAVFTNIPSNCIMQISSIKRPGKGIGDLVSGRKITLRKDLNSNQNIIIHIKECDDRGDPCKEIIAIKENNAETESEGDSGKNHKYYYVETEYIEN